MGQKKQEHPVMQLSKLSFIYDKLDLAIFSTSAIKKFN